MREHFYTSEYDLMSVDTYVLIEYHNFLYNFPIHLDKLMKDNYLDINTMVLIWTLGIVRTIYYGALKQWPMNKIIQICHIFHTLLHKQLLIKVFHDSNSMLSKGGVHHSSQREYYLGDSTARHLSIYHGGSLVQGSFRKSPASNSGSMNYTLDDEMHTCHVSDMS